MAGSTTGVSTTFGLPNYHGELISLSPSATPLLSATGGLAGAKQTDSIAFEWQTYDLRDASATRTRLEGADAPTAEARVRANVTNVVQIFHEAVSTSYTKQATSGMYRTAGSAPFNSLDGTENPVGDEHSWQVMQALKQMARDVNYTMWNGVKSVPTTNATARATDGLLNVISTNSGASVDKKAKVSSASAATDTITVTHDLVADDKVVFTDVGASTTIVPGRAYYVKSVSTTVSFKIALTSGGAAITVGTATVSFYPLKQANTVTVDNVNTLLQSVWDNGGLDSDVNGVIFCNSGMRRKLSAGYAATYGQADPMGRTRNIGGVALDTIVTDFGTLGVATDRHVPADALVCLTLDQISPVFLNIPGRGVLFEEALAKTGAAEKSQLYGEIGLEYGNEAAHGVARGFFV